MEKEEKVVAIVPAYNEEERIGKVLEALSDAVILDEIIVIDDGSSDNTEAIVKKFKNVRYLKNKGNLGKAESMTLGVNSSDAEIIFFCDADLEGLTPEIVTSIVRPVKERKTAMFIGLRENFIQRVIHLFSINSGERALRRNIWETLPIHYKYKYRIEAGLNFYVRRKFGGFDYKIFPYSQPVKEKKYGFFKGTILRWSMNIDVLYVYIRDILNLL